MKKIILVSVLSLAVVLGAVFAPGAPAASFGFAPVELHQLDHIVLAAAAIPAIKPELFTIAEVCRILAIGQTTIYKLIARGELTAIKIGNKTRSARGTRVTAKSVEALLATAPKVEITGKSYLTLKTRRRLAREREQGVSRA
jgi:excisionase family DNA binding protein